MRNFTEKIKKIQEQRRAKLDHIARLQQELDADESNLVAILASLAENMIEISEGVCIGSKTLFAEKEQENSISIENVEKNSDEEGSGEGENMEELLESLKNIDVGDVSIQDIARATGVDTQLDNHQQQG